MGVCKLEFVPSPLHHNTFFTCLLFQLYIQEIGIFNLSIYVLVFTVHSNTKCEIKIVSPLKRGVRSFTLRLGGMSNDKG
jgi:hypothetical protein